MALKDHRECIDIGLSVLCAIAKPGQTMTQDGIAEVCGCNRAIIQKTEKSALKKVRSAMSVDPI